MAVALTVTICLHHYLSPPLAQGMRLGHVILLSINPGPGIGIVPSERLATDGQHKGQSCVPFPAGDTQEDGRRVYTEALPAGVSSQGHFLMLI